MDAHLYIKKICDALREKYNPLIEEAIRRRDAAPEGSTEARGAIQDAIKYDGLRASEGYFWDGCESGSILDLLGLSWSLHVLPLSDEERMLDLENIHKFRDMVANVNLVLPSRKHIEAFYGAVAEQGVFSLPEWHRHFTKKHAALLAFLDQAIELDSPIECWYE